MSEAGEKGRDHVRVTARVVDVARMSRRLLMSIFAIAPLVATSGFLACAAPVRRLANAPTPAASEANESMVGGEVAPAVPHPKPVLRDWSCPFPPESDRAKVDSAAVVLKVIVDAIGHATAVTIMTDPGYGFGEAARACAATATYDPGREADGGAVTSVLMMRVRFERPSPDDASMRL
jgi:hypothetical protein